MEGILQEILKEEKETKALLVKINRALEKECTFIEIKINSANLGNSRESMRNLISNLNILGGLK